MIWLKVLAPSIEKQQNCGSLSSEMCVLSQISGPGVCLRNTKHQMEEHARITPETLQLCYSDISLLIF